MKTENLTNSPEDISTGRVSNRVETPMTNGGVSYTLKQVRKLIIQNVMAYNNTMPVSYWRKCPTAILMCNIGPSEEAYLQRLLELARYAEQAKLKQRQSKQN